MIYLPISLLKAQQIIDISLNRIEAAQSCEDKLNEIDRTWYQLYGMKCIFENSEPELLEETRKTLDFQQYKEFTQINELIYHHMIQLEEKYDKALEQRGNS